MFSYEGSPKKLCGSCSNGLIMANLFRVKVIESNAICRNLLLKEGMEMEVSQNIDIKKEPEVSVSMAEESIMYEEYLEEPFLKAFEQETETKLVIPREKFKRMKYLPFSKKENKQPPSSFVRCCLCEKEVRWVLTDSVQKFMDTLSKIVPLDDCNVDGNLCKECRVNIKNADHHFHQMEQPHPPKKDSSPYNPCQFCFKRCRQVNIASIEMVSTYMALPQPMDQRLVLVGGRACAFCIRNLKSITDLHRALTKLQTRSKKSQKTEPEEIDDIVSLDDALENYQCHMSDVANSDSDDASMPDIFFGEPLNSPVMQERPKCPWCMYTFPDPLKLDAHIAIYHQTLSKTCDICNQNFNSIQSCKQHKCRVHFAALYDNYYKKLCEYCGLATKQLEPHLSIHTKLKPFLCDLCGHRSRSKVRITDHILAIHTNERRYKCRYCGKGFSYYSDQNRHEISAHTKQYKYICEICKKCFLKKNFLKAHQDTHEGVFLKQIE